MKTTNYVHVTVVLLAAIAMKLSYLNLSVAKADPVEETESAKPEPIAQAEPAPVEESEPEPAGPVPPDEVVAELHAKYEEALASQAEGPYEEAQGKLAAGYLRALGREEEAAQEAADLNAVLHWRNEQMAVEGKPAVGDPRGVVPAKLVEMREIFEAKSGKLETEREAKGLELRGKYDGALAGHVKRLTQSGKIEEALAVENWREPYRASEEKAEEPEMLAGGGGALTAPVAGVSGELDSDLFVNSLGMRFVPVPISGGPTDTRRSNKEILFCIWETRVKDYRAFESEFPDYAVARPDWPQTGDHPIVNLGRDDILAFCDWLTDYDQKNGKITEEQKYRLPTDHEWSCAVGIGRDEDFSLSLDEKPRLEYIYPWGGGWPVPEKAGNYLGEENQLHTPQNEIIKGINDGFVRTAPVGSFDPNKLGIFDLGGNVRELVSDWFSDEKNRVVFRGGSWRDHSMGSLESSYRNDHTTARGHLLGFRCVLERSE